MENKVIVITGASSGIGAALAKMLAARGDKVMLAARRKTELSAIAKECGEGAFAVVTDMTKRAQVENLRDEAIKKFGRVDVWINNAGRGITRQVLDLTDEDFDEIVNTNLKSAFYGMQTILPYFMQRGTGHLINVSSALSRLPFATFRSIYSASKAALNSLTAHVRVDLRASHPNVHISLVMPPTVKTDFHANALHSTPGGGGGPNAQSVEQVAEVIMNLIDHPQAEIYTSPESAQTVLKYYADVNTFEENLRR